MWDLEDSFLKWDLKGLNARASFSNAANIH